MPTRSPSILSVDPQGPDACALLAEAALDARALYPELFSPDSPPPRNEALGPRSVYLLIYVDARALASGALRPCETLGDDCAELRRMYVHRDHRRQGLARQMLQALIAEARRLGYRRLVLETGYKQRPAMALYEAHGFQRIEAFGPYIGDPSSVCFELGL